MSILIKGMKMPENCTICRFCVPEADPENGEMCMATGKYVPPCNTDCLENCPLVEVPPHGRLIDADVKHGRWIEYLFPSSEHVSCSECGADYYVDDLLLGRNKYPRFCPNCGAEMDER